MDGLRDRWHADLLPFGAEVADLDAAYDDLASRYGEPHRRYHTLRHIGAVLDAIDDLRADDEMKGRGAGDEAAVVLAGWLHDVIYDATRHDNEDASARYAEAVLPRLGVPAPVVAETARLIEVTAGHQVLADDRCGRVLVDADLGILATPWPVYTAYADGVRAEYAHVPDDLFRAGRAAVLAGFLERPRLFLTEHFHQRFDETARANLRREIELLQGSSSRPPSGMAS